VQDQTAKGLESTIVRSMNNEKDAWLLQTKLWAQRK